MLDTVGVVLGDDVEDDVVVDETVVGILVVEVDVEIAENINTLLIQSQVFAEIERWHVFNSSCPHITINEEEDISFEPL